MNKENINENIEEDIKEDIAKILTPLQLKLRGMKRYDPKVEEDLYNYWDKIGLYRYNPDKKGEKFIIDTPPPTVSGDMHIGHAFSYSHEDFIARYRRMRGYNVYYPWGYDDNGIATELFVEKRTGKNAKDMDRREFIKLCLKETIEQEKKMKKQWQSIGMSVDFSNPYRTISEDIQRISQYSFLELYKKGRIYRKKGATLWCPKCNTALSQVELEDKEKESIFNYIKFKTEDGEEFTIATTRPELLPACVAVFYNPKDERYKKFRGKNAIVPLFNLKVPILEDERVAIDKGTGIVMCCTFGDQTDVEWWQAYNLDTKIIFTEEGTLNELAGKYKGLKIKEARKKIIEDLEKEKLLLKKEPIKHIVNVHERCKAEVELMLTEQWFIKQLDLKEKLLQLGKEVRWYPEYMYHRYENWIKGLQWDWCISRQRSYGIPIPVWYCKKCGKEIVAEESQLPVDPLKDKPPIEKCPVCGSKEFIGSKDVLDTWATSSLTPEIIAKWKKDDSFFKDHFPSTLRPQAHDIITFWAFKTILKSYLHFGKLPWRDIMISGYTLSPSGGKMSKSLGNTIDPKKIIEVYSGDALRYWASTGKLGEDLPVDEKSFITAQRIINKIWNASKFVEMHIDGLEKEEIVSKDILEESDDEFIKLVLKRMNNVITKVTEAFERYEYQEARRQAEYFFYHDLCDNIIEIVKIPLYEAKKREEEGKIDEESSRKAFLIKNMLYHVFLDSIKLLAPIMPFITEAVYLRFIEKIEGQESIHITAWPKPTKDYESDEEWDVLIEILSTVRKAKNDLKKSLNSEMELIKIINSKDILEKIKKLEDYIRAVTHTRNIIMKKVSPL